MNWTMPKCKISNSLEDRTKNQMTVYISEYVNPEVDIEVTFGKTPEIIYYHDKYGIEHSVEDWKEDLSKVEVSFIGNLKNFYEDLDYDTAMEINNKIDDILSYYKYRMSSKDTLAKIKNKIIKMFNPYVDNTTNNNDL